MNRYCGPYYSVKTPRPLCEGKGRGSFFFGVKTIWRMKTAIGRMHRFKRPGWCIIQYYIEGFYDLFINRILFGNDSWRYLQLLKR